MYIYTPFLFKETRRKLKVFCFVFVTSPPTSKYFISYSAPHPVNKITVKKSFFLTAKFLNSEAQEYVFFKYRSICDAVASLY